MGIVTAAAARAVRLKGVRIGDDPSVAIGQRARRICGARISAGPIFAYAADDAHSKREPRRLLGRRRLRLVCRSTKVDADGFACVSPHEATHGAFPAGVAPIRDLRPVAALDQRRSSRELRQPDCFRHVAGKGRQVRRDLPG